ncbi:TonB-dependent siderophore receptor [Pseudopedobacter saltans DSM 12145]|uniref:TonB-dependent siderophore receptor n=1 Tax=Pseudopedobacter saltans (strain ATCC 51119 / DSM 12145 / JCM 21818 / CCUG 39354 / LMG 10337 / NBRC 100064 / NCIMB 13643) TaxID=762903 RepID=F0SE70_PSESL|nr:TonB-dependent receptor [Pseudopedobacter saltans]ADY53992.1 TonB-dependent siderophore receptor [Pseudopedobacter saltans DSM 12145]
MNIKFSLVLITQLISLSLLAQSHKGSLSGSVTGKDGSPVSTATIIIKELNKSIPVDTRGGFTIDGLEPGTYTLILKALGIKSQEKTVSIKADKNNSVSFRSADHIAELNQVTVTSYNTINDKVTEVGKSRISAKDLPQSIQIIGTQAIQDQQMNRLSDVMKNVNGVALGAMRGAVTENFYARGYSLGTNNIFKNGMRTNTGTLPEASTLESVEVLKGSAALLYGGVTGGAVVNMVTKKPQFKNGGEVSFRTGSYDLYKPTVDVYGPISNDLAFRVIGTYEDAGSFRNNVTTNRIYVNPSLLYNIGTKTEVLLQGDYLKSDYTPDFGIGSVDGKINKSVGRNTFINTPWAYNKTDQITTQLNVNHKFNNIWKLNIAAGLQSYDRNYFGAERIQADKNGKAARDLNRSKTAEYTYNEQINLTGILNTGKIKHTLLIGADGDQSRTNAYTFNIADVEKGKGYDTINVFNFNQYPLRSDMPETTYSTRTNTPIYRYGIFVQDMVALTDKFKVLAGIRWTYQRTPESKKYDYGKDETTTIENKTKDGKLLGAKVDKAFSPKFGLIYQPLANTSVYVSYANNFTSNSGYDINYVPMGPSIIDQYEAGVKNDFFGGRFSANLTWYRIENNRFAQTVLSLPDGSPSSDTNMKEFTGKTASDGIELDLTGNIVKGLNFMAGYSYNYMRYTSTIPGTGIKEGERLVGTTKHTGNGTVFYTFQEGKVKGLKLGASAFYTGNRNAGWNNAKTPAPGVPADRIIPLDGFTTFDFSAGYTFKKISILAKISNITNEFNYYVHENYSVNPIAPRQFITTLGYKF